MLHKHIKALEVKVIDLETQHKELHVNVEGDEGLSDSVVEQKAVLDDVLSEVARLRETNSEQREMIERLVAVITKTDEKVEHVKNDIDDVKNRMMGVNVLIHNVPECVDTELVQVTKTALKKSGYPVDNIQFSKIHRLGERNISNKQRTVVARPANFTDINKLLSAVRMSREEKKSLAWISPQYTERIRETRRHLGEIASKYRQKEPNAKISLKHMTLTINGQKVAPSIHPPIPSSRIIINPEEKEFLESIQFQTSPIETVLGSTFVARAINVNTLEDVRAAYKALLLDPFALGATHNIAAYVLPGGQSGYCDDGDYGLGRSMLYSMNQQKTQGRVVFITRKYGGNKLGFQRFTIVQKLTKSVCPTPSELHDLVTYIGSGGKVIHSHQGPPQAQLQASPSLKQTQRKPETSTPKPTQPKTSTHPTNTDNEPMDTKTPKHSVDVMPAHSGQFPPCDKQTDFNNSEPW